MSGNIISLKNVTHTAAFGLGKLEGDLFEQGLDQWPEITGEALSDLEAGTKWIDINCGNFFLSVYEVSQSVLIVGLWERSNPCLIQQFALTDEEAEENSPYTYLPLYLQYLSGLMSTWESK